MSVLPRTRILTHSVIFLAMHLVSLSAFASEIDSVPGEHQTVKQTEATPQTPETPPTAPMEAARAVKTTDLGSPAPTAAPTDADKVIILTERVNQLMSRVSELEAKLGKQSSHDAKVSAKLAPPVSHQTAMQTVKVTPPVANETVLAPVNEDAVLTFRKGYALYQTAKYPEAILEWTRFQKDYPDHVLAGSAQFYLGDSYFKQNEFKLAAAEFQKVLVSYDRSSHLSDALQRLTVCEEKNGNSVQSSKHRQMLKGLFAHSPAAQSGIESGAPSAITTARAGHLDGVPGDKPMTAPMSAPNKPKDLEPEEEEEPKEIND